MSGITEIGMDDVYDTMERGQIPFIKQLDYIPIVSTITGIARAVFGIFQTIIGLFLLPIELPLKSNEKKEYMLLTGLGNVLRGIVATKPIVGNLILYFFDQWRLDQAEIENLQNRIIEKIPPAPIGPRPVPTKSGG